MEKFFTTNIKYYHLSPHRRRIKTKRETGQLACEPEIRLRSQATGQYETSARRLLNKTFNLAFKIFPSFFRVSGTRVC